MPRPRRNLFMSLRSFPETSCPLLLKGKRIAFFLRRINGSSRALRHCEESLSRAKRGGSSPDGQTKKSGKHVALPTFSFSMLLTQNLGNYGKRKATYSISRRNRRCDAINALHFCVFCEFCVKQVTESASSNGFGSSPQSGCLQESARSRC